jgi:hypothetical protein
VALYEVAVLFGTLVAEPSWPAFMCERTKRPDIMDASDLIKDCKTPCKEEAVHIWKIATPGAPHRWPMRFL